MPEAVARLLEAFRSDPRISEGVLTELDRIRASHPVSPEAAAARVEILFTLGNDRATTEAISALLECRPDSARSLLPTLESILGRSPRLAPALLAMARAQRALKDTARAAEACRGAYRVDRGSAPQVIRLCSEMIAEDPKASLPYLIMAEVYLADGEIAAAAEKLFQAAARAEGPRDDVLKVLEEITSRDSGTTRVAFLSAEILARSGRLPAAVRAYRNALEKDPGVLEQVLKGYNASPGEGPEARGGAAGARPGAGPAPGVPRGRGGPGGGRAVHTLPRRGGPGGGPESPAAMPGELPSGGPPRRPSALGGAVPGGGRGPRSGDPAARWSPTSAWRFWSGSGGRTSPGERARRRGRRLRRRRSWRPTANTSWPGSTRASSRTSAER